MQESSDETVPKCTRSTPGCMEDQLSMYQEVRGTTCYIEADPLIAQCLESPMASAQE